MTDTTGGDPSLGYWGKRRLQFFYTHKVESSKLAQIDYTRIAIDLVETN